MTQTITADFDTRRQAEMTVEHLVQEDGLDRGAITIAAADTENSAGTRAAGGDVQDGHGHVEASAKPALAGAVRVSVTLEDAHAAKVKAAIEAHGGRRVP